MRIAFACLLLAGCYSTAETHGETAREYGGAVPVMFTNASPNKLCSFYLSSDKEEAYGDNWLPEAGLPTGGSVEFMIKPGTYKGKWSSCQDAKDIKTEKLVATYAATRVHQTAIEVKQATQLFAFVPGEPPTRFASVKPHYKLEKFEGHTTVQSEPVQKDE